LHYGEWPEGELDHKDRNKGNNHIDNLRNASRKQNCGNSKYRRNTSGYKGVHYQKGKNENCNGCYIAQMTRNGEKFYLGSFSDPIEAAIAYDNGAIEHFGSDYALLNFPK